SRQVSQRCARPLRAAPLISRDRNSGGTRKGATKNRKGCSTAGCPRLLSGGGRTPCQDESCPASDRTSCRNPSRARRLLSPLRSAPEQISCATGRQVRDRVRWL